MASYKLIFKPSAEKDLRRLSKTVVPRIVLRLEQLSSIPFSRWTRKLSDGERLYRARVGDYRIIYEVDTAEGQILIYSIRHRREVYRTL